MHPYDGVFISANLPVKVEFPLDNGKTFKVGRAGTSHRRPGDGHIQFS